MKLNVYPVYKGLWVEVSDDSSDFVVATFLNENTKVKGGFYCISIDAKQLNKFLQKSVKILRAKRKKL
jgi:hypothetical protein